MKNKKKFIFKKWWSDNKPLDIKGGLALILIGLCFIVVGFLVLFDILIIIGVLFMMVGLGSMTITKESIKKNIKEELRIKDREKRLKKEALKEYKSERKKKK